MDEPAVEVTGLVKRFGAVTALDDVAFRLPWGTVLGLLGPNGAGKTTAVRVLATLLRPDGGSVRVAGFDVLRRPDQVRRAVGLSGQHAAVDGYLTGRENLRMIGRLSGLSRDAARRRADELLESLDLVDAAHRAVRTYSGGMRRRLDVAASLVGRPAVLFLDEPTTGLDPSGRLTLWRLVGELTGAGTSVLLTTQYLEEADRLADELVVLDHGAVIARGTAAELKKQVGGDRLEMHAASGTDVPLLAQAVAGLGAGESIVDIDAGSVILPVADGPAALPAIARRLAESDLRVADLALRRPSLDDVFLALTGRPTRGAVHDTDRGLAG